MASPDHVPTLVDTLLEAIADNISTYRSLAPLPGELCALLFERILARGRLTPRILELFKSTADPLLLERIDGLHIRELPPLIPDTRNRWLGDKHWL